MKTTFRVALTILLATACRVSAAQKEFNPAGMAAVVAPFIDQTTVAVAHVDLSRISVDPLVDKLPEFIPDTRENQKEIRRELRRFLAPYNQVGCKDIYVVFSLAEIPIQHPFVPALVILPVPDRADVQPIMEFASKGAATKRIGNILCFGSPGMIAKLDTLKPDPRPELQKAFETAGDTAVQLLIVPPTYTRRLVEQMMPTLPNALGGGSSQVLTRGALWAALGVDLPPELSVRVVLQSEDDRAAEALRDGLIGIFRTLGSHEEVTRELPNLIAVTKLLTPQVLGGQLVLNFSDADGSIASLLDTLKPALDRARRPARRAQSMNNLKQLGLAMHIYHDKHKSFPAPANYDADGKPLLSWRVHILPYVDQNELYKQFHLDEPWDSDHNAKLIPKMPDIYRSPLSKLGDTDRASYLLPVGQETVFPGGKGLPIKEIKDGSSYTIMIVEADDHQAVVWTKPHDLPIDMENPMKGLGGLYGGKGFNATFCDGSARFFSSSIDPKVLGSLFTRAGGEVVSVSDL